MILAATLAIISFAAVFHIHWALGGQFGYAVSLPHLPDGTPVMANRLAFWRPAAGGVALCLIFLALLLLTRSRFLHLPLPEDLVRFVLLFVGAAFVARTLIPNPYVGFFKTLRTTRWAKYDTRLYSPLFLVLGLLTVWQAIK